MFNKSLLGAVIAAGSLIGLAPTAANAQYNAVVSVAPPAPVQEVAPPPRRGHVWVPGHHQWRDNQYVWVQGHWVRDREGYEYREPRWVQRADGHWYQVGNTWERRGPYGDRDRDGIANRDDPDSPRNQRRHARLYGPNGDLDRDGIANQDDRDRDGDGIRNRRDRYPDDPSRS
jgi:hypothetical protein